MRDVTNRSDVDGGLPRNLKIDRETKRDGESARKNPSLRETTGRHTWAISSLSVDLPTMNNETAPQSENVLLQESRPSTSKDRPLLHLAWPNGAEWADASQRRRRRLQLMVEPS